MESVGSKVLVLLLVVGATVTLVLWALRLYRRDAEATEGQEPGAWLRAARWSFAAADLGGPSLRTLALASVLGLFLELLLIRWVSSEIRIFAYFKNFVLIACFLGFGLGFYFSRRRIHLVAALAPLLLLCLIIHLPWKPLRVLIDVLPSYLGIFSEVHVWGVPALAYSWPAVLLFFMALAVSIPLFGLVAVTFVPIGQLIGWHIERSPSGIRAYSVNILGSLAGILLYSLLCFLYQPPSVWFVVAGILSVALLWRHQSWRWVGALVFGAAAFLAGIGGVDEAETYWSPYQKLDVRPVKRQGELLSYSLTTNNSWYQQVIDLSDGFLAEHPDLLGGVPRRFSSYDLPLRFAVPDPAVLVLGSGMGNDVAAALRNGATRVTAVEIDPLILDLGRKLHFEQPYADPRVTVVVNDARSYIQACADRFDLIVFALLDSHTTASHFSNIRIDNYVYTLEALQAARELLAPGGVFVVKFQVNQPWIAGRLHGLLTSVFEQQAPIQVSARFSYATPSSFFVTGSPEQIRLALRDPELATHLRSMGRAQHARATLTTDDWPFFYQQAPGLPMVVVVLSFLLVGVCWLAMRSTGLGPGMINKHFFLLGAGFLLIEVHVVSKMALLFGTTWVVNSVVIAGMLALVVAANLVVEAVPRFPVNVAYAGLVVSLLAAYLVHPSALFFDALWLRVVVSSIFLCAPVFFAGIVYIRDFAAASFRGDVLGSNLMGALVGGLLESLSLWSGLRSMVLLALALYLGSYLTRGHRRVAG